MGENVKLGTIIIQSNPASVIIFTILVALFGSHSGNASYNFGHDNHVARLRVAFCEADIFNGDCLLRHTRPWRGILGAALP